MYTRSTRFYENMKKMRDKSVASYASSMANACGEFSCLFFPDSLLGKKIEKFLRIGCGRDFFLRLLGRSMHRKQCDFLCVHNKIL